MTAYAVNIAMTQRTVEALTGGNYTLHGFKAVKSDPGGLPVVWWSSRKFSPTTTVKWEQRYSAYISRTSISPGAQPIVSASYAIDLNQTLKVTSPSGAGSIDPAHGEPGAISIVNETTGSFTCGISETGRNDTVTPISAFPLPGSGRRVIAPIEQVLLMFANDQTGAGALVENTFNTGMLIDLTDAPVVEGEYTRDVGFDLYNGWSWGGAPWGKLAPAGAALGPLLIQRP